MGLILAPLVARRRPRTEHHQMRQFWCARGNRTQKRRLAMAGAIACTTSSEEPTMSSRTSGLSRRGLLKKGAAAAAAGAAMAAGTGIAQGQAPAVVTGRTFQ